jgi:hypothetical protein
MAKKNPQGPRCGGWIAHALLILAAVVALAIAHPSRAYAELDKGERLTYEALGGAVGFAGSVALALGTTRGPSGGGRAIGIGGALAPGLLLLLTPLFVTPLGVYLAGNASGAHGSYWGSMGGLCVGGLLSLIPMGALMASDHSVLAWTTLLVAGVAGAVIGYEIWNHEERPQSNPSPPTAPNARVGSLPFNLMWRF